MIGEGFYSFDEMKKLCVELCVMLRIVCVSHSDLSEGVEDGRHICHNAGITITLCSTYIYMNVCM